MNKYLLMSAAAALATSVGGTAEARSYSVHFATASGSYCDGETGVSTASYAAGQHVYNNCPGYTGVSLETVGVINKGDNNIPGKKDKSGNAAMSDTSLAGLDGIYSEAIAFDLQTPIRSGGKWDGWVATGSSAFIFSEGTLLEGPFVRAPGRKAETSVAKIEAALRAK